MNRLKTIARATWLFHPWRKEVRMLKDKRTIITGIIMIIFNALRLFGIDVGVNVEEVANAINTVLVAFGLIFTRLSILKVQKAEK